VLQQILREGLFQDLSFGVMCYLVLIPASQRFFFKQNTEFGNITPRLAGDCIPDAVVGTVVGIGKAPRDTWGSVGLAVPLHCIYCRRIAQLESM